MINTNQNAWIQRGLGLWLLLKSALASSYGYPFEIDVMELQEISPRPGTAISSRNFDKYRHLLDKDLGVFIDNDFLSVTVGEPTSFRPHPAFVMASKRSAGSVRLSEKPGILENFKEGLPFPAEPKLEDADAGRKLAWNMRYAYFGDSGKVPEMFWQLRDWRSEKIEFDMEFKARLMRFMYRHVQVPVPALDKNPQDAFGAAFLTAVNAGSYDRTQALIFANRDESEQANGWVYIPQLERTQSLASFRAEESMFGSDILATDFLAYTGSLVDMSWNYKGSTYMLLPAYRHDRIRPSEKKARKYNYWHVGFGGRAGCFPKVNWQLRRTHILEGKAKENDDNAQKRIFYVDAQTFAPLVWKIYKSSNKLWKFIINTYAHPNTHVIDNNESGAPIATAFSTIDTLTNRCTTVQLFTLINPSDVQQKDFDPTRMRAGGRRLR